MCLGSDEQNIGQEIQEIDWTGLEIQKVEPEAGSSGAGNDYSLVNTYFPMNQREGVIGNS